ncbi:hypothetical protein BJX63DRAFT_53276 [Aspergillus granulosus]|uniref:Uncharacterized protein n=1 Tax=Aspergillus granulosus TaxID=176169 RepID=A0ABR4GXV7_9EURO
MRSSAPLVSRLLATTAQTRTPTDHCQKRRSNCLICRPGPLRRPRGHNGFGVIRALSSPMQTLTLYVANQHFSGFNMAVMSGWHGIEIAGGWPPRRTFASCKSTCINFEILDKEIPSPSHSTFPSLPQFGCSGVCLDRVHDR